MKWEDNRQSSNIEDRRSQGGVNFGGGGNSMMLLAPIARVLLRSKIGRIVLVICVIAYFMGYNPLALLNFGATNSPTNSVVN
ncbi:MAG: hypothetical protein CSA86_05740, partial [Arcobacter sp.]